MSEVGVIASFVAGLLSFLSPCVLPLIPGYISFISGESISELTKKNNKTVHIKALIGAFFFGLGFSIVFVLLGASATEVGKIFSNYKDIFEKVAGVIVIIFGLHLLGVFKINSLTKQKKWNYQKGRAPFYIEAFLLGVAFVFGWTPCIGPILASILTFAANKETTTQGIILLSAYSVGLWFPFLLSAVFLSFIMVAIKKAKKVVMIIEKLSGILLIFVGILIMSNTMSMIVIYTIKFFNL